MDINIEYNAYQHPSERRGCSAIILSVIWYDVGGKSDVLTAKAPAKIPTLVVGIQTLTVGQRNEGQFPV